MAKAKDVIQGTRVRDVLRTSGTSLLIAACLQLVSILVVRSTGIGGRGEIAAAVLVPTAIGFVAQLGLPSALTFLLAAHPDRRRSLIGTSHGLAVLLSCLGMVANIVLSMLVPLDERVGAFSVAFSLYIPLQLFAALHMAVFQVDLNFARLNRARLLGIVGYLLAVLALYVLGIRTIFPFIIVQLIPPLVQILVSLPVLSRNGDLAVGFNGDSRSELLQYGTRALWGTTSPVEALRLDQIVLGFFMTPYALGIYVIGMTFVTLNRLIGVSVGTVVFPLVARATDASSRTRLVVLSVTGSVFVTVLAALGEIGIGEWTLSTLFAIDSKEAYSVMSILVISSVFMVGRQVHADALRGIGLPGIPALSELVYMTVLFIVAFTLWQKGVVGVALGVAVSAAMAMFFQVLLGRRVFSQKPLLL